MPDHELIRFQPKYPRYMPLAMGFLVLLGLFGPFMVLDPTATIWEKGSGLILFFFLPFVFASLIKEIEFAEDIRIRRHFAPTQIFSYSEFVDVGNEGFTLTGLHLDWKNFRNGDELESKLERLVDSDRINPAQLANERTATEKASRIAEIGGVLLGVTAVALLPDFGLSDDASRAAGTGISLTVMAAIYAGLRRSQSGEQGPAAQVPNRPDESAASRTAADQVYEPADRPEPMRVWVGPNWKDHYEQAFERLRAGRSVVGWNWAAALFPPWWVYRKQWLGVVLIIAVDLVAFLAGSAALDEPLNIFLTLVLPLGLVVGLGLLGDRVVLQRGLAYLATRKDSGIEGERKLRAHGRPALFSAVLSIPVFIAFYFLMGF